MRVPNVAKPPVTIRPAPTRNDNCPVFPAHVPCTVRLGLSISPFIVSTPSARTIGIAGATPFRENRRLLERGESFQEYP